MMLEAAGVQYRQLKLEQTEITLNLDPEAV